MKMYDMAGGDYVFKYVEKDKSGANSIIFEDFYAKSSIILIYMFVNLWEKQDLKT